MCLFDHSGKYIGAFFRQLNVKNLNRMGIGHCRNRLWALFVMGYGCSQWAYGDFVFGDFFVAGFGGEIV